MLDLPAEASQTAPDSREGRRQPRPLLVAPEELDEAIKRMPLELIAGLQVAIVNVALVADAGVGRDATVDLPQGQRIVLRNDSPARTLEGLPPGESPGGPTEDRDAGPAIAPVWRDWPRSRRGGLST